MRIDDESLGDVAVDVVSAALRNYHSDQLIKLVEALVYASYGVLQGYELRFSGIADGERVDVVVFLGQGPERFPVLLQAYTLAGKLDALADHIRRSWTSVRYLK